MKSNTESKRLSTIFKNIAGGLMITAMTAIVAAAQFTYNGDYDRTFGATNGYTTDPGDIVPELTGEVTQLYTAQLLPDGSIIAGGRMYQGSSPDFFYVKKYTPGGAVDTSFGTGGIAIVNFFQRTAGSHFDPANGLSVELPSKLAVQPDGKILIGGQCIVDAPPGLNGFGTDACLIRLNANGSVDTTFGNNLVITAQVGGVNQQQWLIGQGRMLFQTGAIGDGAVFGTGGTINDIVIEPDGQILLAGQTRDYFSTFSVRGWSGFLIRLNPNGTPDQNFGVNGVARYVGSAAGSGSNPCWTERRLVGLTLLEDGKILGLGSDGDNDTTGGQCLLRSKFAVTRWSANGILETNQTLSHANISGFGANSSYTAKVVGGGKVLISGSNADKAVLGRFHLSTLTPDTSFSNNGFTEYLTPPTASAQRPLFLIDAIMPNGKIVGRDNYHPYSVLRFNPDGSADQSFGNESWNDALGERGRSGPMALFPNGQTRNYVIGATLLRPNGRLNFVGYGDPCNIGPFPCWGIVTQQNTTSVSGIQADFTNDGKAEIAVYRPADGMWYQQNSSSNAFSAENWGLAADRLAPADFNGDGKTDIAVFRNGAWYIKQSGTGTLRTEFFGTAGDLPRPGDFDGDGRADIAVFRPSNGTWYAIRSRDGQFTQNQFGANGDAPLLGDFDADGKSDITVFRNGTWYQLLSTVGLRILQFGVAGDVPVPGDYDGDSRADLAVFRNGTWYILKTTNGAARIEQWGIAGDRPTPADYDNDGRTDISVFRNGTWWTVRSGDGGVSSSQFGTAGDMPVPAAYLP
ncbi:MAG: FG-GAP repeat protein [Chloracidobacterium sp.]|nr:FG-GAP repeat protein [Chloracidobacterium sp.]